MWQRYLNRLHLPVCFICSISFFGSGASGGEYREWNSGERERLFREGLESAKANFAKGTESTSRAEILTVQVRESLVSKRVYFTFKNLEIMQSVVEEMGCKAFPPARRVSVSTVAAQPTLRVKTPAGAKVLKVGEQRECLKTTGFPLKPEDLNKVLNWANLLVEKEPGEFNPRVKETETFDKYIGFIEGDMTDCLPPELVALSNTYSEIEGVNCVRVAAYLFGGTKNFKGELSQKETEQILRDPGLEEVKGNPTYGDMGVLFDGSGQIIHAFIAIGADRTERENGVWVFTKNGVDSSQPFQFQTFDQMAKSYPYRTLRYYRWNHSESPTLMKSGEQGIR